MKNEIVEFKRELNDYVIKEIIAFCNTNGGTIIIGYDDNGIAGRIETENGKDVIVVKVLKGINKPYYIKSKGMTTHGVYVRCGSISVSR